MANFSSEAPQPLTGAEKLGMTMLIAGGAEGTFGGPVGVILGLPQIILGAILARRVIVELMKNPFGMQTSRDRRTSAQPSENQPNN